jgi:hypothetical protein
MYCIGGSVIVMVTLVEGSNLVIKLIIGMCVCTYSLNLQDGYLCVSVCSENW